MGRRSKHGGTEKEWAVGGGGTTNNDIITQFWNNFKMCQKKIGQMFGRGRTSTEREKEGGEEVEQWLGDMVGWMHTARVTGKELAKEVGWHPKYLSAVLNGRRKPKNARKTLESGMLRLQVRKERIAAGKTGSDREILAEMEKYCPEYTRNLRKAMGEEEG